MSVQSEINRIKTAVNMAYTAVYDKGGTIPETRTVENLSDAIRTISGGGSGQYNVVQEITEGDKCRLVITDATGAVCIIRKGNYTMKATLTDPTFVPVTVGSFGATEMITLYNNTSFYTSYGIGCVRTGANAFTWYKLQPDGTSTGNTWYNSSSKWPSSEANHIYRVTNDTVVSQEFFDWFNANHT